MLQDRLASLEVKHKKLHAKIDALEAEKAPDKYITPLKKQKLMLKDEIEQIRKSIGDEVST